MKKLSPNQIKRQLNISYLGSCSTSPKLIKSMTRNVITYGLYLAPYNLSGYNVCPESCNCSVHCLHGSGRNKIELLTNREGGSIQNSRIKKTKFFFEDRSSFMHLLIHEINKEAKKAKKNGMQLAVRLNCTSDISLKEFALDGKNILQIFPDLQFYDYTKVPSNVFLSHGYDNYDLTFSFDGNNWEQCKYFLGKGIRVAVVFEDSLPEQFRGYPVINANDDDARFLDGGGLICGLTYKKVANDYVNGRFQRPDSTFINRTH